MLPNPPATSTLPSWSRVAEARRASRPSAPWRSRSGPGSYTSASGTGFSPPVPPTTSTLAVGQRTATCWPTRLGHRGRCASRYRCAGSNSSAESRPQEAPGGRSRRRRAPCRTAAASRCGSGGPAIRAPVASHDPLAGSYSSAVVLGLGGRAAPGGQHPAIGRSVAVNSARPSAIDPVAVQRGPSRRVVRSRRLPMPIAAPTSASTSSSTRPSRASRAVRRMCQRCAGAGQARRSSTRTTGRR